MMRELLAAATLVAALPTAAVAGDYPSRPITLVVPLSVGGSTDIIARVMAHGMEQSLGQRIVVENTSGAGGTIGEARVAHAAPDGYTFGIGQWGTNMANGAIYSLQYDLVNDFEPIGLIATQPFLIVARKSMPAKNLTELIAWIRAQDGKATEGNSGVGSPSHVSGILFQKAMGAKLTMIPYRGAGESSQALVAEQTDVMLDTPAVSLNHVRNGETKAYAVTARKRLAIAPEIPTTDEAGLPGFYFSFWHGFWAPKGTPKDIVTTLNGALRSALNDPDTRKRLLDLAQEIFPPEQQSPEALRELQKAEIGKWWPIIKEAGIRAQ